MRDDHTLEPENGAATPADRSPETNSTERPITGARRLQERLVFRTSKINTATRGQWHRLAEQTARKADSIKANPYAERAAGMWTASRDRVTAVPGYDKMRSALGERGPARVAIATGVLAAVGVAAAAGTAAATQNHDDTRSTTAAVAAVDSAKQAEIGQYPSAPLTSAGGHAAGAAKGSDKPAPAAVHPKAEDKHDKAKSKPKAEHKAKPKTVRPTQPKPVMGLSQSQMNNAMQIVKVAEKKGMGERAAVIAVATSMQESQLLNLASDVIPESMNMPHQGSGSDHDSVGLFQQRSTSGWGSVDELMNPQYSAGAFLDALKQVPNWQNMPLSAAAQTVQVSAFPDAYAQHEYRAQAVVDALMN